MQNFNHNRLVRSLQSVNHVLGLVGLVYVFVTAQWHWLLIALLTYWFIGVFGINVGMHRLLSHRSFKTHVWFERFVSVIGVLTTVGSPLAWVAIHRQHHRAAETPEDPHSPYQIGNFRAWFGIWPKIKLDTKLVRDMRQDKFQRALHKHYVWIIAGYALALFVAGGPLAIIFGYCIPASLCLHSSSAIIVIAHRHGYKTHACRDQSRNSWIANLITLGEGWHNNHHARPWAWSNWERWWEWDVPAIIIWAVKK
jgi:stearoyl-CoA desaturase (delta-9 desaturase)